MKRTLRELVPPAAIRSARWLSRRSRTAYPDYAAARANSSPSAYEEPDIIAAVLRKTHARREQLRSAGQPAQLVANEAFGLCSLLAATGAEEIRVLDFGGACGAHYFLARHVLAPSVRLRWIVVETRAMAEAAAASLADQELGFSSDVARARELLGRVDLVFSSGAIQYMPDPSISLLQLVDVSAPVLCLNRVALRTAGPALITVDESQISSHAGPAAGESSSRTVRIPCTLMREADFLRILGSRYEVRALSEDPSGLADSWDPLSRGCGVVATLRREP